MDININFIASIVGIIAGILTIVKIIKEFFDSDSSPKQQTPTKVEPKIPKEPTKQPPVIIKKKYTVTSNSSNDDIALVISIIVGTFIFSVISLAFYSQTYRLIPMFGLLLLACNIYKDSKLPFENNKAKIQWAFQKILFLIVIFTLFFIPKSVLNIVNQIPAINLNSFPAFVDWLTYSFNIVKDLFWGQNLPFINLIFRIVISFAVVIILFSFILRKNDGHKTMKWYELFGFIIFFILLICASNIELFWDLTEPLRNNIEAWFNPLQ